MTYHRLSSLKQYTFVTLKIWRSEVSEVLEVWKGSMGLKSRCPQGCILKALRKNQSLSSFSFQMLPACLCLPLCVTLTSASFVTSLTLTLLPTSDKDPCDYIGSTWIIEKQYLQSPFCHVRWHIHRFWV